MKKILIIALLLITASAALFSQYFFDNFTDVQKLDTAHAYLMVSEQFAKLGDTKQAKKFKDMALFIYPGLLQVNNEKLAAITAAPEKPAAAKPVEPDQSAMIRYYFSKLLMCITSEDLDTAGTLIADRLYLPQYEGGLTQEQLRPMVLEIAKKYDLSSLAPSDLYKIDTIKVKKVEDGTYLLTVEGADNEALYKAGITFFGKIQTFEYRHYNTGWKIDKITAVF